MYTKLCSEKWLSSNGALLLFSTALNTHDSARSLQKWHTVNCRVIQNFRFLLLSLDQLKSVFATWLHTKEVDDRRAELLEHADIV